MSYADFPFSTTPYAAEPIENAVIQVTGVSASFALQGVGVSAGGSVTVVASEDQMDFAIGTVIAEAQSIVPTTGVQADTELGTSVIAADSNLTLTGEEISSDTGTATIAADAVEVPTSVVLSPTTGTVTAGATSVVTPTGINLTVGLPGNPNEYSAEGSTALSTDEAKFGVSSVEFDGTSGQGVQQNVASGFGSGDFTSEFWIYSSSIRSQSSTLWDFRTGGLGLLLTNLNGQISFFKDGAGGSSPTSILTNDTWHHIAIVRSGSTGNVYVDGNLQITRTIGTDDYSTHTVLLGNNIFDSSGYLSGYIDEYRDSNIVRYSSNFTPQSVPFTVDSNTYSLLHFDGIDGSTTIINSAAEPIIITGSALTSVTGEEASTELGTLTAVANADVDVTGIGLAFTDGTATATGGATATPTGVSSSFDIGGVVIPITVSGVSMQFADGTPIPSGSALVNVTGIEMSSFVGNMRSTPWANVVTGASNTWTEVAA